IEAGHYRGKWGCWQVSDAWRPTSGANKGHFASPVWHRDTGLSAAAKGWHTQKRQTSGVGRPAISPVRPSRNPTATISKHSTTTGQDPKRVKGVVPLWGVTSPSSTAR